MNNRFTTTLAAALMGLGLVVSATPASAAPGRFYVDLIDAAGNNLDGGANGPCPATGGARFVGGINNSVATRAVRYRVRSSPCKLTIFDGPNGTGNGVGLQRDGRDYGLGVARLRAHSIAAYGSA